MAVFLPNHEVYQNWVLLSFFGGRPLCFIPLNKSEGRLLKDSSIPGHLIGVTIFAYLKEGLSLGSSHALPVGESEGCGRMVKTSSQAMP